MDKDLAVTLFARHYTLWNDKLLARLQVDETSMYYLPWLTGVRAFASRLPSQAAPVPGVPPPGSGVAAITEPVAEPQV